VRERLPSDQRADKFVLYDIEGELFFGAAPHLDRFLGTLSGRIDEEKLSHVVLRMKRARHPDAVCLERLEHFLKACGRRNVSVLLAGLQSDLLVAARRLGFFAWYPQDRVYVQGKDEESATIAAIRAVFRELGREGTGAKFNPDGAASGAARPDAARPLYYLP
jgi:SulP family sulfate permease